MWAAIWKSNKSCLMKFFADSYQFQFDPLPTGNTYQTEPSEIYRLCISIIGTGLWLMFVVTLPMSKEMNWMTRDREMKRQKKRTKCALKKKSNWYYAHQNEIKRDLPLITECDKICWYLKLDYRSVQHGNMDSVSPIHIHRIEKMSKIR